MLFAGYAMVEIPAAYSAARPLTNVSAPNPNCCGPTRSALRDRFALLPRVLPFIMFLAGVMLAVAARHVGRAGLGAVLALALITIVQRVDAEGP